MSDAPGAPRRLVPMCDKIGAERIEQVVHAFYRALHADDLLGPIFAAIPDRRAHEQHIIQFWWLAMGGRCAAPRHVDMVGVHAGVGVTDEHLTRWLALFERTLQDELPAELARDWAFMAQGIGGTLRKRLGLG